MFPKLTNSIMMERLEIPAAGKLSMVLDTDTYNEIDDQFALAYALLSGERLNVEAVYAAPFHNERSVSPGDGMEKSYEEILRVLERMQVEPGGLVYRGSDRYLESKDTPCVSDAARDLVDRAMKADGPLYVAAIGAPTNIASAILMEPGIIEKIVVIWLGGTALHWPSAAEFNLEQDVAASQLLFDCGVPMIRIPCTDVTSHLLTTVHEVGYYLKGKKPIANYLYECFQEFVEQKKCLSKVVWDIAAVACLVNPEWVPAHIVHSPILTDQLTWSMDRGRHFGKDAFAVQRDAIFLDVFSKLCRIG